MPNWKPGFYFRNQVEVSTNGEVYATKDEAMKSAHQRFMVWTMPTDFTAIETEDPVNGVWIDGIGRVTDSDKIGQMAPDAVKIT